MRLLILLSVILFLPSCSKGVILNERMENYSSLLSNINLHEVDRLVLKKSQVDPGLVFEGRAEIELLVKGFTTWNYDGAGVSLHKIQIEFFYEVHLEDGQIVKEHGSFYFFEDRLYAYIQTSADFGWMGSVGIDSRLDNVIHDEMYVSIKSHFLPVGSTIRYWETTRDRSF